MLTGRSRWRERHVGRKLIDQDHVITWPRNIGIVSGGAKAQASGVLDFAFVDNPANTSHAGFSACLSKLAQAE